MTDRSPSPPSHDPSADSSPPAMALIPAAGRSRRMGRPKLLLPFPVPSQRSGGHGPGEKGSEGMEWEETEREETERGQAGTVLGATARALLAGGAGELCLVVGPGGGGGEPPAGAAEEAATTWRAHRDLAAWGRRRGARVAVNRQPERGMLSSIRAGLEALGGAEALAAAGRPLLVCPGDLPRLSPETVAAVLAALAEPGCRLALPVVMSEEPASRNGHPLAIAPELIPEILRLDLTEGLRQLKERFPDALRQVPVSDPGAVRDVDTPADYERLRRP